MTRHFPTKLIILLAFLAPETATAQSGPIAPSTDPGPGDALALESRALRLQDQRSTWREAARLYRLASSLREEGDGLAIADRTRAGYLEYYRGAFDAALEDFLAAAAAAHETGHVVEAADDYINAAWAAARLGDAAQVRALTTRARRLTRSPLLTSQERRSLLLRIDGERAASPDR